MIVPQATAKPALLPTSRQGDTLHFRGVGENPMIYSVTRANRPALISLGLSVPDRASLLALAEVVLMPVVGTVGALRLGTALAEVGTVIVAMGVIVVAVLDGVLSFFGSAIGVVFRVPVFLYPTGARGVTLRDRYPAA